MTKNKGLALMQRKVNQEKQAVVESVRATQDGGKYTGVTARRRKTTATGPRPRLARGLAGRLPPLMRDLSLLCDSDPKPQEALPGGPC